MPLTPAMIRRTPQAKQPGTGLAVIGITRPAIALGQLMRLRVFVAQVKDQADTSCQHQ